MKSSHPTPSPSAAPFALAVLLVLGVALIALHAPDGAAQIRIQDPNAAILSCDWNCSGTFCSGFCQGKVKGSHPPFELSWTTSRGLSCIHSVDDLSAQCPCDTSLGDVVLFTATDTLGNQDTDTRACGQ